MSKVDGGQVWMVSAGDAAETQQLAVLVAASPLADRLRALTARRLPPDEYVDALRTLAAKARRLQAR